jgi:hypothetical protein
MKNNNILDDLNDPEFYTEEQEEAYYDGFQDGARYADKWTIAVAIVGILAMFWLKNCTP